MLGYQVSGLGQVEPLQQETNYTCSAASLLAVLGHYGVDGWTEETLARVIGATEKVGATPEQIVDAAHSLGLQAFKGTFVSLAQAKQFTDQDVPLIALVHSFVSPGKCHFVVVTKIGDSSVELMDPNVDGNVRVLSSANMVSRWTVNGHMDAVVVSAPWASR